ncbi:sugar phosphate isomerase/epimerase family protein [Methanosalsum natronophilum]|uniref:Sugar phosphate isomerase/epimerase n=1 Tax=Methanosalsum natronophilum TaxID=768733 RepID=A0A3R7XJ96_9EURY|nr:sugar phosphate isomerase/epimerase [Methanosalsum natronophilum]MCS3924581.1 sugar phosphate isomerase/epimerase [Methanosalsum natronophilum]RQD91693.1 MAG: sugar phosphate isomerase/epimerase [Methanosalsum natronophilum]
MLGISSFSYSNKTLSEALEVIENKVACAEIFCEGMHDLFKYTEIPLSYNLKYAVHAPCSDLNIASIRERIRKASIGLVEDVAYLCQQIGAEVMVLHPGYFSYSCDLPAVMKALETSLDEMEYIREETGVLICLENMPADWNCFVFQNPGMDLKNHGFTLDIGHANTTNALNDFLKQTISHLHIHDNNGTSDEHLPVGDGNIDFNCMRHKLKSNGCMKILEHRTGFDVDKSLETINTKYKYLK